MLYLVKEQSVGQTRLSCI